MAEDNKSVEAAKESVLTEGDLSDADLSDADLESSPSLFHLRLLPLVHELQQKHGLRHNDYQRYRSYCSRRLARIRKHLKLKQGEKKRFTKREVDADLVSKRREVRLLHIPVLNTERAWAYAMQLKFEMNTEPRKKYHMLSRLKKACVEVDKLMAIVEALNEACDARTKLEVRAYKAFIHGTHCFETQAWKEASTYFTTASTIYTKLKGVGSEEEQEAYTQRLTQIVPSLRFCAYNAGQTGQSGQLPEAGEGLEALLSQAREQQASRLQDVEWKGRKMAVKLESVRIALMRDQQLMEELDAVNTHEKRLEVYEAFLLDCKDAIQGLRDELVEDPAFRQRQQNKEGVVTANHFLYTYLCYIKTSRTVERNLEMISEMRSSLDSQLVERSAADGRRQVKPQDLMRLYETIIQSLKDLPELAGLEEDEELRAEIEAKTGFFKAWRCNYMAQAFMSVQKWPEAMALFQRATMHAKKAQKDKNLEKKLKDEVEELLANIESRQFMAHAKAILESEALSSASTNSSEKKKEEERKIRKLPLAQRLDEYVEDPQLVSKPNLVEFPPAFEAVAVKPFFFDLACEQVEMPEELKAKMEKKEEQQGKEGGQGWLGGWLGWGAGKK